MNSHETFAHNRQGYVPNIGWTLMVVPVSVRHPVLTHLPLDNMAAISQTSFFKCIFTNVPLTICHHLVHVMTWRRTGGKPLLGAMTTQFTDAYMRQCGEMPYYVPILIQDDAVVFQISSLTHWGRVTHICVGKLTTICSDNGLSPGRRPAIIWTNAGISLIRPLETYFSEVLIEILTFAVKELCLKVSSAKWRPFVSASVWYYRHKRTMLQKPVEWPWKVWM